MTRSGCLVIAGLTVALWLVILGAGLLVVLR